jgi:DnaJ-class molecular chaperone
MRETDIDDRGLTPDPNEPAPGEALDAGVCAECQGAGALPSGETCPVCEGTGRATNRTGGG